NLVAKIRESGGEATAVPTDATNEEQVFSLFKNPGADMEVAVYNAGNNHPGRIVEMIRNISKTAGVAAVWGDSSLAARQ
ncbi:MAG: hypothetical protein MK438_07725, partial [SAR324 cluster bacterium]|nr:hypothetical protein [SAR324 cluster bacterium]